jgi:Amt family ammonium transporter
MRIFQRGWLAAGVFALLPGLALAEPAALNSGDTAWMLTSTMLVLMMTIPGLALFYGGLVRKKNVVNTLMQCFVITALVSVLWFAVGYSLVFTTAEGAANGFIGNFSKAFLQGVDMNSAHSLAPSMPEWVFVMYQMTFAIITPALIIGSFVERIKFSGMLLFMALWSLCVYAPVAHMVWGGGILTQMGALDYAGGTVVHITAGVAGLVACLVLGKRHGFDEKRKQLFSPNNITFTMIGASLLWVGWFGFNAGSALTAGSKAGIAMLNTHLAASMAALAWMFAEWLSRGKPTLAGITAGAVAGLVAVTPAAGFIDPMGAMVIGLASGALCLVACVWLKEALGYDDSLDVVGIHGMGGFLGSVLAGVFALTAVGGVAGGIEGNWHQVWVQVQAVALVAVYTAVLTWIILKVVGMLTGLRVASKEEDTGLDLSVHGESA